MRELINAHNTRHTTIDALDAAIGYTGQLRALINAAESRGRLPRADLINAIAGELVDVHPVEVLLAFARDAGVDMPPSVDTTSIWHRMLSLPTQQRQAIMDSLDAIVSEFERLKFGHDDDGTEE